MQKIDDSFMHIHMKQVEELILASIPPEKELNHVFSKRFNRKMKALLKYERRTPFMRSFVRHIKVATIIGVIFMGIAFSMTMSVEAYRIRFFNFITKVYNDLTSIIIDSNDKLNNDLLIPCKPTYIPVGYSEKEIEIDEYKQTIIYTNMNNNEIIYTQKLLTQGEIIIDTENANSKMLLIGEQQIDLIDNKGVIQLIWYDSKYAYILMGAVNQKELINMAKSIIE